MYILNIYTDYDPLLTLLPIPHLKSYLVNLQNMLSGK